MSRQRANDLVVLREAAFLLFRKDQFSVGDDVELALPTRYCVGVMSRALVQLGRETRSPAVIAVSDGAVEDLDAGHETKLSDGARRKAPSARPRP